MNEQELVNKIKELKNIKPNSEWVSFTKQRILSQKQESFSVLDSLGFVFNHKAIFSGVIVFLILIGSFGMAQRAVPGDPFFAIKKMGVKVRSVFVSKDNKLDFKLGQAQKRLDDLTKIIEANKTKKLDSAINEYQETVSDMAETLAKEKDSDKVKEIVLQVQELEEQEDKVKSLGTIIERNLDLDFALIEKMLKHINNLEIESLNQKQRDLIQEIQQDVANKDYDQALIKSLEIEDLPEFELDL